MGLDPAADWQQADLAEALLRKWTAEWNQVADLAGIAWPWSPFSAGDVENALCIDQDHRLYPRFGRP